MAAKKSPGKEDNVTVVYTWRVNKGKDDEFHNWLHGIAHDAFKANGHLGVSTFRVPGPSIVYESILRFDSQKHLDTWLNSKVRKAWIEKLDGIATEQRTKLTGLETWFDLPIPNPPPRWKMVIATFIAVYPVTLTVSWLVTPHLAKINIFIRSLVVPIILPVLLTYLLMPIVTQRILKRWLYK